MTYDLHDAFTPEGHAASDALPRLRALVEQYPYYHGARMAYVRALYDLREPQFNDELRIASLSLPSRTKIYQEIEGESMLQLIKTETPFTGGATHRRKSNTPLEQRSANQKDRTGALIDSFLQATPTILYDTRKGRSVDATTDYMSYLLQEESMQQTSPTPPTAETSSPTADIPLPTEDATNSIIDEFISTQGDRRIRLTDKKDSELQKPSIDETESIPQKGVFTETLARIYIKQGKFEQAIEIIRRLSLKYPKKNRYFADQIRFLEKLLLNQKAQKGPGNQE